MDDELMRDPKNHVPAGVAPPTIKVPSLNSAQTAHLTATATAMATHPMMHASSSKRTKIEEEVERENVRLLAGPASASASAAPATPHATAAAAAAAAALGGGLETKTDVVQRVLEDRHQEDRQKLFQTNLQLVVMELIGAKEEVHKLQKENEAWREEYLKLKACNDLLTRVLRESQGQGITAAAAGASPLSSLAAMGSNPLGLGSTQSTQQQQQQQQATVILQALSRLQGKDIGGLGPSTPSGVEQPVGAAATQNSPLSIPSTPGGDAFSLSGGTPMGEMASLGSALGHQPIGAQALSQQELKNTTPLSALLQSMQQQQNLVVTPSAFRPGEGETGAAGLLASAAAVSQFPIPGIVLTESWNREQRKEGGRKRNRGLNLPRKAVKRLKEFLYDHFDNPYPSETQKGKLAKELGLDVVQVNTWFINARMRLWKPHIEKVFKSMKERLESNLEACKAGTSDEGEEMYNGLLEKYHKVQEAEDPRAKVAFMMTDEWAEKVMQDTKAKLAEKLETESNAQRIWASEADIG